MIKDCPETTGFHSIINVAEIKYYYAISLFLRCFFLVLFWGYFADCFGVFCIHRGWESHTLHSWRHLKEILVISANILLRLPVFLYHQMFSLYRAICNVLLYTSIESNCEICVRQLNITSELVAGKQHYSFIFYYWVSI